MPSLELYIGKSKYIIDCAESEKLEISKLAAKLNERVNNLSLRMRGADEKTILMLSSIMIEAELDALENSENKVENQPNQDHKMDLAEKKSSDELDSASFFIERMVRGIPIWLFKFPFVV